jgi:hypothetical protein
MVNVNVVRGLPYLVTQGFDVSTENASITKFFYATFAFFAVKSLCLFFEEAMNRTRTL